ncbi:LysM peptidoglycan-binding domain-containing protein [Amycolatopsis orientalis]|uniref:LysM peptidoglycan-binding domain-containing protein n=1 Tax=Amycolatopsis orientalis TaxID=31958 RepID=UPI0003A300B6|nr:LysM peptidoglycan-binding domain-containing protein [Amycolatopsis orientalis]
MSHGPGQADAHSAADSAEFATSAAPMPPSRDAATVAGPVGARSAVKSAGFSPAVQRGARATTEIGQLPCAAAVRSAERAGFETAALAAVEIEEVPVREPRGRAAVRSVERAGFQTSASSAIGTGEAAVRKSGGRTAARSAERAGFGTEAPAAVEIGAAPIREARGRAAARSAERAGFQTSAPSAVETEDAPVREFRKPRGRTAVRHIPAALPANPGRTARERRGEPLRPPSRARVVAGRRGGVACSAPARPAVRWPWLFAIAFAACLIVTGLGVFGAGVSGGPVPSRTASVSVQPGDSLGSLAARFAPDADQGAVVERIKELNNLDDTALLPGMPLTVPIAWSGGESGTAGS